jgi:hypothetical protein
MNFKKKARVIVSGQSGEVLAFWPNGGRPQYDIRLDTGTTLKGVREACVTPAPKRVANMATSLDYLTAVAKNTPSEQAAIATEQFLVFAEQEISIVVGCNSGNEQFPELRKRYEAVTGFLFPASIDAPDPQQGPKLDMFLPMEAAQKLSYPVVLGTGEKELNPKPPMYFGEFFPQLGEVQKTAIVEGHRAAILWALLGLGYVIGPAHAQDRARIAARIAEARMKLV